MYYKNVYDASKMDALSKLLQLVVLLFLQASDCSLSGFKHPSTTALLTARI